MVQFVGFGVGLAVCMLLDDQGRHGTSLNSVIKGGVIHDAIS